VPMESAGFAGAMAQALELLHGTGAGGKSS
jgi:hypothetical protein